MFCALDLMKQWSLMQHLESGLSMITPSRTIDIPLFIDIACACAALYQLDKLLDVACRLIACPKFNSV
jgi:hypothetical protein